MKRVQVSFSDFLYLIFFIEKNIYSFKCLNIFPTPKWVICLTFQNAWWSFNAKNIYTSTIKIENNFFPFSIVNCHPKKSSINLFSFVFSAKYFNRCYFIILNWKFVRKWFTSAIFSDSQSVLFSPTFIQFILKLFWSCGHHYYFSFYHRNYTRCIN